MYPLESPRAVAAPLLLCSLYIDRTPLQPQDAREALIKSPACYMSRKFASALSLALIAASCQATTPQNIRSSTVLSSAAPITYGPLPQVHFDTSHWKIYSDSFISFKYPPDWKPPVVKRNGSNGPFVISLFDQNNYQVNGSRISPIQISFSEDTVGSSINRLFPDVAVQRTLQEQHTKIDGQDAYVLQGSVLNGFEDLRVVFTNNLAFIFESHTHTLPTSIVNQQEIENIFDTILTTIHF